MFTVTRNLLTGFCKREDGPTAVEYAVMVALIVVVCAATIAIVGTDLSAIFTNVAPDAGTP